MPLHTVVRIFIVWIVPRISRMQRNCSSTFCKYSMAQITDELLHSADGETNQFQQLTSHCLVSQYLAT